MSSVGNILGNITLGVQDLDRDRAVVLLVRAKYTTAIPPRPSFPVDGVAIADGDGLDDAAISEGDLLKAMTEPGARRGYPGRRSGGELGSRPTEIADVTYRCSSLNRLNAARASATRGWSSWSACFQRSMKRL